MSEADRELKICAELPGVSENWLDDDGVTRGENKFERKDEKENYHFGRDRAIQRCEGWRLAERWR